MKHSTMSWCPAVSCLTYLTGTVKKTGVLFLSLFLWSAISVFAQVEPPANDDCDNAIQIFCGESLTGSTSNANPDFPPFCEPNPFNSGNGAEGVWYYHVGSGMEVTINMNFAATDYDSYLNVYTGDCNDLFCVVGDDDSGAFAGPSIATFFAEQGVTYLIYVTGFGSAETGADGNYEFQISCLPTCEASLSITCPDDLEVNCGDDLSPESLGFPQYFYESCPGITAGEPLVEVNYFDDYISDDCPQIIARTWVAETGNLVAMCTQYITLIDNEAPYFTWFPDDITIECSEASTEEEVLVYLDNHVPFPTFDDNCSAIDVSLLVVSTPGENCPHIGTCTKTVTITDGCGNSTSQTLTVTILDTQGPVINGVEESINVQCIEDVPAPVMTTATDGCSGEESVEVFTSHTGEPIAACDLSTAMGPGQDWALWLPMLYAQGHTSSVQFVFDTNGGQFVQFPDGTAHLFGTIENTINPNEKFVVDFWFQNAADWATWSAMGRDYKDDMGCAQPDLYEDWTYYEMVNVVSTLTGQGDLAGAILNFYHMPNDYYYGFQIGQGANNKNCEFGLSGWFTYSGFVAGQHIEGHGDVNVNADCEDVQLDDCPNETEFTYIYHAIDDCDNASIIAQVITVHDDIAPVFENCPLDLDLSCIEEIPAIAVGITATDNCTGDVLIEYLGETTEGEGCEILITRTWSATDQCENRSYCIQHIYVHDELAPVFEGLNEEFITAECDNVPAIPEISASDNCDDAVEIDYNEFIEPGQCPYDYYIHRNWIATDNCGNSNEFHQVVHVQDTTAPVADFETYIFLECNEVDAYMPEATDNCGEASIEIISQVLNSGGCMGVWQRIYLVTDECGNTATLTQYISLLDNTPPVILGIPASTTVECSEIQLQENGYYCSPELIYGVDDCGLEVIIEYNEVVVENDDNCPQSFDVIRTWTATDQCDNQSTATAICHVVDTTAPYFEFVPGPVTIECDEEVPYTEPIVFDLCGGVTVGYEDEIFPGECPQESMIVRTFYAEDECENISEAQQIIYVVDTTAPSMEGVDVINIECGEEIPYNEPTAGDNCSDLVSLVYADYSTISPWFFYSTPGGNGYVDFSSLPEQIVIGGSDGNLQLNVLTAAVTVATQVEISFDWSYSTNDSDGSSFDPFGYMINGVFVQLTQDGLDSPQAGSENIVIPAGSVFALVINAEDNLFGASAATISNISVQESPLDCPVIDCILRQFTATDECGNASVFNQFIYTYDTTEPYVDPYQVEVSMPCDQVDYTIGITAGDSCSAVEIDFYDSYVSGTCQGHIIRDYVITDACGNTAYAQQIITLVDELAPVLLNPADDVVVECGSGLPEYTPLFEDNCDEELTVLPASSITYLDCGYQVHQTWTASDNCGNSTTAEFNYTVVDTTAPVLSGENEEFSIACNISVLLLTPTVSDVCDNEIEVIPSQETIAGDCPNEYTDIFTWTATDDCGNTAVRTIIVHHVDELAPEFSYVPEGGQYSCDEEIIYGDPIAVDNCGAVEIGFDDQITSEICENNYMIVRTWTATDACGNSSSASATYYVSDETAPELWGCPQDLVLECDEEIPVAAEVNVTDNCDDEPQLYFNEYLYGDIPGTDQNAGCDLLTPSIADAGNCAPSYNNTSWAMWLGGMPLSYKYYVAVEGSFEEFDNGTAHLQVVLANAYDASGGFTADVWFYNGMDWATWDNMPYPTGFKADCGGLDIEHFNWTYYLMNNDAATLTGWGTYSGSFFTLTHAPSNNYFGYQVGNGANNLTSGFGSGGWFEYVGTLIDSSTETVINVEDLPGVNNGGDFAFEHHCCPDFWVVREWCAVDCSGNWTCCSQTITYDGQEVIYTPQAPSSDPGASAVKDDFDFIAVSPNPASEYAVITFTTKVDDHITMEAYDMSGRMVNRLFSNQVEAGMNYSVNFNTSQLENGIYQVRLYSPADSRVKKLIIGH